MDAYTTQPFTIWRTLGQAWKSLKGFKLQAFLYFLLMVVITAVYLAVGAGCVYVLTKLLAWHAAAVIVGLAFIIGLFFLIINFNVGYLNMGVDHLSGRGAGIGRALKTTFHRWFRVGIVEVSCLVVYAFWGYLIMLVGFIVGGLFFPQAIMKQVAELQQQAQATPGAIDLSAWEPKLMSLLHSPAGIVGMVIIAVAMILGYFLFISGTVTALFSGLQVTRLGKAADAIGSGLKMFAKHWCRLCLFVIAMGIIVVAIEFAFFGMNYVAHLPTELYRYIAYAGMVFVGLFALIWVLPYMILGHALSYCKVKNATGE